MRRLASVTIHRRWLLIVSVLGLLDASVVRGDTCSVFQIRWTVYQGAPPTVVPGSYPVANVFAIIDRVEQEGSMPKSRTSEIRPETILVKAVDASGAELAETRLLDPRLLRVEDYGVSAQTFHRSEAFFIVDVPYNPAITHLKFYEPTWTSGTASLQFLGTVSVQ